jgi:DNA-binding NarL/FixJ family response regulator
LVLDIAMPHARGIDVLAEVRRWSPATKIMVFSGMTSAALFRELVDAQADGIFVKRGAMSEFAQAVPRILAGERLVAPQVQAYLEQTNNHPPLTLREQQILSLLAQGSSNKDIAARLGVAAKTVDNHRTNLMRKVGVHSLAGLLAHALREGLLEGHRTS